MLTAEIIPGKTVKLDPETVEYGGWLEGADGALQVKQPFHIELVHHILMVIENPVLIDVGAYVGNYTLLTSALPGLSCFAYEPNPDAFDVLWRNVELNGVMDRVFPYCLAVGDEPGKGVLKVPLKPRPPGLATLGEPGRFPSWVEHAVDIVTLDSLPWRRVDFIKIDAEGAELMVLRGAKQTIEQHHPAMLIECVDKSTHQFGYDAREIIDLLDSWGYASIMIGAKDALAVWRG